MCIVHWLYTVQCTYMSGLCRWLFYSVNVRFACCCLIGNFAISKLYCLFSDNRAHSNNQKNMQLKEQTAFCLYFLYLIRPDSKYFKWYHVRINMAVLSHSVDKYNAKLIYKHLRSMVRYDTGIVQYVTVHSNYHS